MPYRLCYIFHSGFALLFDDMTVVMDYFEDSNGANSGVLHEQILGRGVPVYVLSTHFHHDHYNSDIFGFDAPQVKYILSKDIYQQRKNTLDMSRDIHFIKKSEIFDDGHLRVHAFGSTDEGVSFAIFKDNLSFFHAGDLNNWHWMEERPEPEWRRAENDFIRELGDIRKNYDHFDLVMFPVDPRLGSEYMRGAGQFIDAISCKYFCPMHFDLNFDKARAFAQYTGPRNIELIDIDRRGQMFDLA